MFDTGIFILAQRRHQGALDLIDDTSGKFISTQTYMEFLQGAKNKAQLLLSKSFLRDLSFFTLPFTENIGHRATIYIEQFALSHHMRSADALIAATAVENDQSLLSANAKHFRHIPELELVPFKTS